MVGLRPPARPAAASATRRATDSGNGLSRHRAFPALRSATKSLWCAANTDLKDATAAWPAPHAWNGTLSFRSCVCHIEDTEPSGTRGIFFDCSGQGHFIVTRPAVAPRRHARPVAPAACRNRRLQLPSLRQKGARRLRSGTAMERECEIHASPSTPGFQLPAFCKRSPVCDATRLASGRTAIMLAPGAAAAAHAQAGAANASGSIRRDL